MDATDNFSSHHIIDKTASLKKKPVVFGIVCDDTVMISAFHLKKNSSFLQLFSSESEYQDKASHPVNLTGDVILYNMAGNLMANEVLKIILDQDGILDGKVMKFNVPAFQILIDVF